MNQFSIYRLRTGEEVCCIQTDLGVPTAYLLSAPVVARDDWGPPVPRLHVAFDLAGRPSLILMTQMVALPTAVFGAELGSAAHRRDEIVRAVDLLVTGF